MKGFGIEIKNNLLEPKHIKSMDISVWLYMFLIDKITSITEDGVGTILGGRPLKYSEIKAELGISQNTYTRWIDRLSSYPYITVKKAPYGIIFTVLKAHKRFTINGDSQSMVIHQKKHRGSPEKGRGSPDMVNVIKTIQDNNNNNTILAKASETTASYGNKEINEAHAFLKEKLGGTPDGTQNDNRRFAKLLLDRMKKDYPEKKPIDQVKALIEYGLKDEFHSKNITSFRYLYYNTQKIIQSVKGRLSNPKYIKIK